MMSVMLDSSSKLCHGQIMEYWLTKKILNQKFSDCYQKGKI